MAAATSTEACAAYVSMLRARRLEDERTRKRRGERRADVLTSNVEHYRARERRVRSMLMRMKLKSLSRVEGDLYDMLDEQAQWRHVMRENVRHREEQRRSVEETQAQQRAEHLEHALQQEADAYAVAVKDDEERWQAVRDARARERANSNEAICGAVLDSVVELAADVVGYVHEKEVLTGADDDARRDVFGLVPRPVFQAMKLERVYSDDAAARERRVLEEHEAMRPADASARSVLLSALVSRMRECLYPAPEPLHPVKPSPKAFIVLSGPKYSGKSAVAREAAEALNLEYVSDVSVIDECLGALEGDITAADLESRTVCDRLMLGREVRQRLQAGEDVDDELLARMVLFKIDNVAEDSAGILFDGVPRSREAFEIVESKLSGYRPGWDSRPEASLLARATGISAVSEVTEDAASDPLKALDVERPPPPPAEPAPTGKDAKKADAKAGAKKDKKKDEAEDPLPPIELPEVDPVPALTEDEEATLAAASRTVNIAGLQRVVRIECSPVALFERYCGLRVDAETGEEYHVRTNPPPLERIPFTVAKDRSEGDTAKMHAAIEDDRETWDAVRRWLGTYEGLLDTVDGNAPLPQLIEDARGVISGAVETAAKEHEAIEMAAVIQEQRKELEALHAERMANREAVRKQLHQIYTERGVDPLPPELAEPPKQQESPLLPVPAPVPGAVWRVLEQFEAYYTAVVNRTQGELATLFSALFDHGVWASSQLAEFFAQPDGKQKLLDAFVADINAMPAALRSDPQGKDELHLRADSLLEGLTAIVEKRREDGTALVDTLLAPQAFLDAWSDAVRLLGTTLMQLELERVQMVRAVAAVYYGGTRGEAVPPEDPESVVDLIVLPKSADQPADAAAGAKAPGGKDAKGKPAPKKGGAAAPPPKEEEPRTPEEFVAPLLEKAAGYLKATVEKLAAPPQPVAAPGAKGKAAKAQEAPPAPEIPTAANLCVPLVQDECDAAKARLAAIGDLIVAMLNRGLQRNAAIRTELGRRMKSRVEAEMSASNGALVYLRAVVEEEAKVCNAVVLDGAEFAIDGGLIIASEAVSAPPAPSPRAASPLPNPSLSPSLDPANLEMTGSSLLLSSLTFERLQAVIRLFHAVAPDYAISEDDFCRIVSKRDWTTGVGKPAEPAELFRRFDWLGASVIDWREYIVHLLFWCEPLSGGSMASAGAFSAGSRNPYYVEGPTLLQLFDLKSDLGISPLTKDVFLETELFFEVQMDPQRLAAYKEALWMTFAVHEALDPNEFVMFLCSDEQPLRGTQKAFAMAAMVGDEACALDVDMTYRMFHFSACNHAAFGMDDPYSHQELRTLFDAAGAEVLNFQEACGIGMGRVLLNNTVCFRRRKFTV